MRGIAEKIVNLNDGKTGPWHELREHCRVARSRAVGRWPSQLFMLSSLEVVKMAERA
jgi:hypothetical protein